MASWSASGVAVGAPTPGGASEGSSTTSSTSAEPRYAPQLRVPGDLAIVGYDDIDFAAAVAVPLSSVRQPRDQLGRAAAELLIEEAAEGTRHGHRQIVFEPQLVARDSSDHQPGA